MSLYLLLDENISHVVSTQINSHRPGLVVESVHKWRDGMFRGQIDEALLIAASEEHLTLVTYDQKTIPEILGKLYADGHSHAGVIFVDNKTIDNGDFGSLTRALIYCWDLRQDMDWTNRIYFLDDPNRR